MKKLFEKVFVLSLVMISFVHPTVAQNNTSSTSQDEEQVRNALQNWSKVSASGEKDKYLNHFTEDAVIMSPGQPAIKGKEAIWQIHERSKSIPGYKLEWDTESSSVTVSKGGDLAYVTIKNRLTMQDATGATVTQNNKAVLIWRKQPDNTWKEALLIFNEDPS
jgi:uncharacterized protein (TIGR02246 family)